MRKLGVVLLMGFVVVLVVSAGAHAQTSSFQPGAVFVMTNAADRNEVISFTRAVDGSLSEFGAFATGGRGSGGGIDPLRSQGSLGLSADHAFLFAVNAGSGDVSVFRARGTQLELLQVVPSGGSSPVAIAQRGGLLYVLNAGPNANVVGFRWTQNHRLEQIPGSTSQLSTNNPVPSGLAISPDGEFLAVTEQVDNLIDTFRIKPDGTLGPIVSTASSGSGPFSIEFAPSGALLVTEAPGAAITSYAVQPNGALAIISGSVSTQGQAACWHVITPDGRFVYTSNAGSSTISGFAIGPHGSLTPVGATVVAAQPQGSTNLDIALTQNGKFFYSLNAGTGTVGIFAIERDGTLVSLGTAGEFPAAAGANGIAAF